MRWWLLVLGVAGCDKFIVLDEQEFQVRVTGEYVRIGVTNDENYKPRTTTSPFAPGTASIVVRVGNTQTPVELAADGTFEFFRPSETETYRLLLSTEGRLVELQHDAPDLKLVAQTLGRENAQREPVTQPTYLYFPLLFNSTIVTTGIWASSAPIYGGTYHYSDWKQSAPLSGRRALLKGSANDRLYFFDYVTPSNGISKIGSLFEASFDMTDGMMNDFSTMPLVTAVDNACANLSSPRVVDAARFYNVLAEYPNRGGEWVVYSIPDADVDPQLGLTTLTFASEITPTDLAIATSFTNPFPGGDMIASVGYVATRKISYPGALQVDIVAFARVYAPLISTSTECAPAPTQIAMTDVAIPGKPMFAGVSLDADNVLVTIDRTRDVELTWPLAELGRVDRYATRLIEVSEDPVTGNTSLREVRRIESVEPRVLIDPTLLISGGYYLFETIARTGYPDAADGNFTTLQYPSAIVRIPSAVFQVQ